MWKITNISATCSYNCELDLPLLGQQIPETIVSFNRFHTCKLKLFEPKATLIMFQSGKVNIVGARCEMETELAAHAGAARLNEIGIEASVENFRINNVAAAANIGL